MRSKFAVLVLFVLLALPATSKAEVTRAWFEDKSQDQARLATELCQEGLHLDLGNPKHLHAQLAEMHELTLKIENMALEIGREADSLISINSYLSDIAIIYKETAGKVSCEMLLRMAESYSTIPGNKYKPLAKELYRNLISTYTGLAYKGYVKRAEFGLEDLKENK